MLTDQDIKQLSAVLATKQDVIEIKEELSGLKDSVQALTSSIDGILKKLETLSTEFIAMTNKVNRLEEWIRLLAEKTGTKLPT